MKMPSQGRSPKTSPTMLLRLRAPLGKALQYALLLPLLFQPLGCDSADSPSPAAKTSKPTPVDSELTRDQLAALGYISRPDERRPMPADTLFDNGLVLAKPTLMDPGFTLLTTITSPRALLVDGDGFVRHIWESRDSITWMRAKLQLNGDLLVAGQIPKDQHTDELGPDGERIRIKREGARCRPLRLGRESPLARTDPRSSRSRCGALGRDPDPGLRPA